MNGHVRSPIEVNVDNEEHLLANMAKPPSSRYSVKRRGRKAVLAMIPVVLWYVCYVIWGLTTNRLMPSYIGADGKPRSPNASEHVTYALCVIGFSLLFLIGAELLYRAVLLVEEICHLSTRYHGSILEAIMETFTMKMSILPLLLGVGWTISLVIMWGVVPEAPTVMSKFWEMNGAFLWTQLTLNSVILALVGLRGPCKVEMSHLLENNHLNVAHGLAWSYYFGYLRFVTPGFRERIKRKAQEQTIEGSIIPKLVVLIPESCYAFDTLNEADGNISFKCHVEFQRDRGGNIGRTFNQTMYCISKRKKHAPETIEKHYCAVEYATPLMALHEMVEAPEAGMNCDQMHEQMRLFYTTLHHIINLVPEVANNVILIPYNDRTSDGHQCCLSEVILSGTRDVH